MMLYTQKLVMPCIPLNRINNIRKMRNEAIVPYLEKYGHRTVLIFSMEHGAFWGPDRCGYYQWVELAGHYKLTDALDASMHCGPEKGIHYCFIPTT